MLIFLFPVYDLQKDEKIVKGFHEIRRDSFHRLCWLYFGRENQLWVKFLAEYFRHKPSHLNIKKRQSFDKNLHSKAAKGLNSWHPYIKGQSLLSRGGGNIFTRWLRASSTLTWSWTRALKLETRPHLLGWILVNCPTQPTCIAHCDLCIYQPYFITNPQWKCERNTAGQWAIVLAVFHNKSTMKIWKKYSLAIS